VPDTFFFTQYAWFLFCTYGKHSERTL
jgi:hypothetical protein